MGGGGWASERKERNESQQEKLVGRGSDVYFGESDEFVDLPEG